MSFFGKFKSSAPSSTSQAAQQKSKDPNAAQLTSLEKHLLDISGPVRPDGSDKYFGFENYGSTCYCNSIIQCLYYSAPFRENVINFPSADFVGQIQSKEQNGAPLLPRRTSTTPYPNPTSPARKPNVPTSPGPGGMRLEEQKDTPEYRKRMALQTGPVLDMTDDHSNKYAMDESLFTSLRDIFEAVIGHQSRIGVVSPHRFLEILRRENEMFRSAMHQDAHEFFNLLLNQVVDNVELFAKQHPTLVAPQMNGAASKSGLSTDLTVSTDGLSIPKTGLDTQWARNLFEGLLTSETRCLTCENTSQRDEAFLDLSVDLSPHTSVTSCLRKFSEEEMLCERNKFHCDNCGGLQEAEKRMKIKRLPRILALHLKRFKYTEDLQRLQKLFHRVVYPFHLRLFNTTDDAEDPDRLYELYAVVVHIGGGPYHGHYVSIIKTQDRGWLLFDDELVEPVSKSYVMNFFGGEPVPGVQDAKQLACAYVLFYQETTMEAMLKEQDAEGSTPQVSSVRVSDVETAKDLLPHLKNGESAPHIAVTHAPIADQKAHMEPLAHAATSPLLPSVAKALHTQTSEHPQSVPAAPVLPSKSKKELKQEEKDRKATKRVEERLAEEKRKVEEKAAEDKRREASIKRIEAHRKAEEEMKQTLDKSKQTAAEEAKVRGDVPLKEGALARFRHGSMSLRKKPILLGSHKDKDAQRDNKDVSGGKPQLVSQGNGLVATTSDPPTNVNVDQAASSLEKSVSAQVVHAPAVPMPTSVAEDRTKKHRFSLGRKKSALT